jgi:hypothetical protein
LKRKGKERSLEGAEIRVQPVKEVKKFEKKVGGNF